MKLKFRELDITYYDDFVSKCARMAVWGVKKNSDQHDESKETCQVKQTEFKK